jgi:hypothetical protein
VKENGKTITLIDGLKHLFLASHSTFTESNYLKMLEDLHH